MIKLEKAIVYREAALSERELNVHFPEFLESEYRDLKESILDFYKKLSNDFPDFAIMRFDIWGIDHAPNGAPRCASFTIERSTLDSPVKIYSKVTVKIASNFEVELTGSESI